MTTAFPLQWPEGWPRTKSYARQRHNFGSRVYTLTFERARSQLFDELKRMGAKSVVLSTDIPLRQDGMPYAGAALKRMDDPGVAVYFTLKAKQLVMAQDRYSDIAANVRSLGLAIEGLRQMERHGGGTMMERAFAGFAALPNPEKVDWRAAFGFTKDAIVTRDMVNSLYRMKAAALHPDAAGGSESAMSHLNVARDLALKELA